MTLIEEINYPGVRILFYDGIDFDMIFRNDSEDFLIFFIDSWVEESKKWNRESKIKTIVDGTDYKNFCINDIKNRNVAIYQTSGCLESIYKTIRDKIVKKNVCAWGTVRGLA